MIAFLLVSYAALCVWTGMKSDILLKYQFEKHHDSWVMEGKPHGMFFKPRGSSVTAAVKKSFKDYSKVPYWVQADCQAQKLHSSSIFWAKLFKHASFIYLFLLAYLVFWR